MVMPIGDVQRTRIVPFVTYLLIAANVAAFLLQASRPDSFTVAYAATPYEITHATDIDEPVIVQRAATELEPRGPDVIEARRTVIPQAPVPFPIWGTLLTSMFLHGGFLHLAGNMLFLWVFGNNIEDTKGKVTYVIFYLLAGLAATAAHIAIQPASTIPVVGASGAIAGVMGAYLILFPNVPIKTLVIFFFITFINIRAKWLLGFWFLSQFLIQPDSGVAWMAHVGGFAFGVAAGLLWKARAKPDSDYELKPYH